MSIKHQASEPRDIRDPQPSWEIVHRLESGSGLSLNADKQAIHESLQRQREQRTKRVKSILP